MVARAGAGRRGQLAVRTAILIRVFPPLPRANKKGRETRKPPALRMSLARANRTLPLASDALTSGASRSPVPLRPRPLAVRAPDLRLDVLQELFALRLAFLQLSVLPLKFLAPSSLCGQGGFRVLPPQPLSLVPPDRFLHSLEDAPRVIPSSRRSRTPVTLPKVSAGTYEFRARAVDRNDFAQPEPRPYPKSGRNEMQCRQITVMG